VLPLFRHFVRTGCASDKQRVAGTATGAEALEAAEFD
jgi:hypothetical protein